MLQLFVDFRVGRQGQTVIRADDWQSASRPLQQKAQSSLGNQVSGA
jgi:hypothetical protein